VRLEYNKKKLKVSILSPYGLGLEPCFEMPADLEQGGYLVVSSSSTTPQTDYHEILNIKVLDPMFEDLNTK